MLVLALGVLVFVMVFFSAVQLILRDLAPQLRG